MSDSKITALYCRVSREDELIQESSSIETQKAYLSRYANSNKFYNIRYYIDDGYSWFKLAFQLITKRYEKKSTIVTTNLTFSKWGEVFGNNVISNAILDRLLHHSTVHKISGKSYRTKDYITTKAK
jgi:DNA invertase Pin-like site-specific DNA recombinase